MCGDPNPATLLGSNNCRDLWKVRKDEALPLGSLRVLLPCCFSEDYYVCENFCINAYIVYSIQSIVLKFSVSSAFKAATLTAESLELSWTAIDMRYYVQRSTKERDSMDKTALLNPIFEQIVRSTTHFCFVSKSHG